MKSDETQQKQSVNEAKFNIVKNQFSNDTDYFFKGVELTALRERTNLHNVDARKDVCEAAIKLSIAQHAGNCNDADEIHVTGEGAEDLRKKLHAIVDDYIGYYYDYTNGA
jgi:hypothetical protein